MPAPPAAEVFRGEPAKSPGEIADRLPVFSERNILNALGTRLRAVTRPASDEASVVLVQSKLEVQNRQWGQCRQAPIGASAHGSSCFPERN